MRIDTQVAKEFIDLQTNLPKIMQERNISLLWISEKTGIAYTTLRRKLLNKQLTGEELLKVAEIINK